MGLDTYAGRTLEDGLTDEDQQAFLEADIQLCGGIHSGTGGSFRGKVYFDLILDITGVNLYQEWIPPDTVAEMYQALAACDPEIARKHNKTPNAIYNLKKFFKICADRNLGLYNWS